MQENGRQARLETHLVDATVEPGHSGLETQRRLAGLTHLLLRIWRWLTGWSAPVEDAARLESTPLPEPAMATAPEPEPEPVPALEPVPTKPRERKSSAATASLRNEITEAVTGLIEQMTDRDFRKMSERYGGREYEEALGHLMECDFHFVDDLIERTNGGSQWVALHPDDKEMREMMWPIDIAAVSRNENGLHFSRFFTATPASLRGKVKLVPQRAAWLVSMTVENDDRWFAQMNPVGLINGEWKPLDGGMVRQASTKADAIRRFRQHQLKELDDVSSMSQSLALTARYHWHVAIGNGNGPRVLLPTNPQGCLELFRTREKRDGETRRAALRHWVSNHFRETDESGLSYVCDHLRGTTEFNWRGFDTCEIFVSEFDLEKNEFFKQQASEWRAKRKHNRVIVRIEKKPPPKGTSIQREMR